jgi:hypothetical protein
VVTVPFSVPLCPPVYNIAAFRKIGNHCDMIMMVGCAVISPQIKPQSTKWSVKKNENGFKTKWCATMQTLFTPYLSLTTSLAFKFCSFSNRFQSIRSFLAISSGSGTWRRSLRSARVLQTARFTVYKMVGASVQKVSKDYLLAVPTPLLA